MKESKANIILLPSDLHFKLEGEELLGVKYWKKDPKMAVKFYKVFGGTGSSYRVEIVTAGVTLRNSMLILANYEERIILSAAVFIDESIFQDTISTIVFDAYECASGMSAEQAVGMSQFTQSAPEPLQLFFFTFNAGFNFITDEGTVGNILAQQTLAFMASIVALRKASDTFKSEADKMPDDSVFEVTTEEEVMLDQKWFDAINKLGGLQ